jgi:hypothetical protein
MDALLYYNFVIKPPSSFVYEPNKWSFYWNGTKYIQENTTTNSRREVRLFPSDSSVVPASSSSTTSIVPVSAAPSPKITWRWESDDGQMWKDNDSSTTAMLEKAYTEYIQQGSPNLVYNYDKFIFDFKNMTQTNKQTGSKRSIWRCNENDPRKISPRVVASSTATSTVPVSAPSATPAAPAAKGAAAAVSTTPIKIEAVQAFREKDYSIMNPKMGFPTGGDSLTSAVVSCPKRILDSFIKIIEKSKIPGMVCDNPYVGGGKITFPTKAENFGAKDLQVIARNESINTTGIMNIALYNDALSVKDIGTIRCLVKGTTVAGLTYPIQTGKYTKTLLPKPYKLAIVIDQSGLQWQFSIYNTGALFFYIDTTRYNLEDNIPQGTTTLPDKQITIKEYIQWQKDMYKVMYGVPRPDKPTNPKNFTFAPNFVLNGFMGDDLKLGFKTEFLQAFHAVHNISKNDKRITYIEFRFLKAGMGFFSQCIKLASDNMDKTHIAKSRLEGIIDAINELDVDNIRKYTKIRKVTLPYLTDNDATTLGEEKKFTELLALEQNAKLVGFLINSGEIDAFATPAEDNVTLATTNCGDPHAMTGNEGNNGSTDALLVMNAYLHHLNSAFNYDHVTDDIYNYGNKLIPASPGMSAAVPAPAFAPAAAAAAPLPAVSHNLTASSKKSLLSRFSGFISGIKNGGKSGSNITRKRRLRLKKSRNVTRHKGGKKSVRFSARVKLNNGTGKGTGKGTSNMNKKTRKVSSSSYKLSARRVIKLKR